MLTLQSWWIVRMSKLLQLAIIASVFSCVWTQSIDDQCGSDNFSPFFPHVYYFEEDEDHLTVCPPAGTQQDAVVCITRNQETPETYTRTNSDGVIANICLSTMSNESSQWCTRSGEYDAVAIETTGVNSAGFIEIASTVRFTITFEYGPTLEASVPLRIETGLILNTITSVIIQKKVYGLVDPSYTVCQVQENGTVVSTGFSASSNPNPECKIAAGGTAIPASVASDIILRADAPTSQEETVTLFLTNTTCSQSAFRITENFPLTIITTPTPNTTATGPTPMITTLLVPVVIVGVVVPVVFLFAIAVTIIICFKLRNQINCLRVCLRTPEKSGSTSSMERGLVNGNRHIISSEIDSSATGSINGVELPGLTTPNCIYIFCENPNHPWYKQLLGQLNKLVQQQNLSCIEWTLPEDPDKLHEFELEFYQLLNSEHVHHLLLFQNTKDSESHYSRTLIRFINELESRGRDNQSKVFVIILGALKENVLTSAIKRLSVTQMPDDSGSATYDCAQSIYQAVTAANGLSKTPSESTDGLAVTTETSCANQSFPGTKHTKEPDVLVSATIGKQQHSQEFYLLSEQNEMIKKEMLEEIRTQGRARGEAEQRIESTVCQLSEDHKITSSNVKHIAATVDEQAIKHDKMTIEQKQDSSESDDDA